MGEHASVEEPVAHVVRVDPAFARIVEAVSPPRAASSNGALSRQEAGAHA